MPGFFFWVIQQFRAIVWFPLNLLDYVMRYLRLNDTVNIIVGARCQQAKPGFVCLGGECISHHLS